MSHFMTQIFEGSTGLSIGCMLWRAGGIRWDRARGSGFRHAGKGLQGRAGCRDSRGKEQRVAGDWGFVGQQLMNERKKSLLLTERRLRSELA